MVRLSPKAATALFSIITATYLENVQNEEGLESLIGSVQFHHSTIYQQLAGQHQALSADERAVVDDVVRRLIGHLRDTFVLSRYS